MNTALSAVGYAKQSAKGTAAGIDASGNGTPVFYHGVTGGKMVDFEIEQKEAEITTGLAAGLGEVREAVAVGADFGTLLFPGSIGIPLMALHGTVANTGPDASGNYSHAYTLGDSVPYYTIFGEMDTELRYAKDAKCGELKLAWKGNSPVEVNETWAGCLPGWLTSVEAITNDESRASFITPAGGWFKVDLDGTSPAAAKVLGGEVTYKRAVEADIVSGVITADDVHEGALVVDISLDVRVSTLADLRTIATGTAAGETVTATTVYGSCDLKFLLGLHSLRIEGDRIAWQATGPDAEPKGGPAEIKLKGRFYIPAGETTNVTTTLVNDIATY